MIISRKIKNFLKDFLKDFFLIAKIRNRFNSCIQIEQRHLFHYYKELLKDNKLPPLNETGFRVFSQFEEDGKLLFIFSVIGMEKKSFVEIGSDDGINSNCANLYFNFGWHGVFIDANKKSVRRGMKFFQKYPHPYFYKPKFVCAKVTPDNINQLIQQTGYSGEIGLLSIDIDGDDYWIWKAITVIDPRVVIIESHNEFGDKNIVIPYNAPYDSEIHGASPVAMSKLAKKKGYRLVGANEMGFNLIFIKQELMKDQLPEVTVDSILTHPSVKENRQTLEYIKDQEYIIPED